MQKKILTKAKKTAKPTAPKPRPALKKAKKQQPLAPLAKTFGLHSLKVPRGAHKRKKLLGRGPGSGHGKTSTRGSKGQTSRSGRDFYLGFEGGQTPLIRRIPKRGFTSPNKLTYQIVNLAALGRIKETNITLEFLEQKGLIRNKTKPVKILGEGEVKQPLSIQAHAFSKSASEKIKNAGGSIQILNA